MARTITVEPGTCPDDVWDDDHYLFPNGVFKPFAFSAKRVTLEAQNYGQAIIDGGINVSGEPDCSIRGKDGCDGLAILGLAARNSPGRGIRVTNAKNVVLHGVISTGHALEACTLAFCPDLQVADSEFGATNNPASIVQGYTPDKKHGLYISHEVHRASVARCYFHDCPGSGLQANGKDGPINRVTGRELKFFKCGSAGTLALSLMGVLDGDFSLMHFEKNNDQDAYLGILFSDGGSGPCMRVNLHDYSPAGIFNLQEAVNCRYDPGTGWDGSGGGDGGNGGNGGNGGDGGNGGNGGDTTPRTLRQRVTSLEGRVTTLEAEVEALKA